MKILIGCEESQRVTKAFRELGHEAYSCDLFETSGDNPEWHYQMDIFELVDKDPNWDMMIAFPPCTFLCISGNRWFLPKYKDIYPERPQQRQDAIDFFLKLYNLPIEKIAIENPVGIISTVFRKPDQIIHPYMFGEPQQKQTCLWLKNLPKLVPTNVVEPLMYTYSSNGKKDPMWHMETSKLAVKDRSKARSKTFQGIANAMATQWS